MENIPVVGISDSTTLIKNNLQKTVNVSRIHQWLKRNSHHKCLAHWKGANNYPPPQQFYIKLNFFLTPPSFLYP